MLNNERYERLWVIGIQKKVLFPENPFLFSYKPIPLFKEHVLLGNALDWQKFNWHKSHQQNGWPANDT